MGRKAIDMTGETYGFLLVIHRVTGKRDFWLCFCDPKIGGCGHHKEIRGLDLRREKTRSCGCLRKKLAHAHAVALNGGIYHECQYSDKRLRELYDTPYTISQIAALARVSHDDLSITPGVVRKWLQKANVPLRPRHIACRIYAKNHPDVYEHKRRLGHIEIRRKVAAGEYCHPTKFDVNPFHHKKALNALRKYHIGNRLKKIAICAQREREAAERQAAEAAYADATRHGTHGFYQDMPE